MVNNWRVPVAIASIVLFLDQATKHWAVTNLNNGETISVFWTLQLNLAFNTGMSFSLGRGFGPLIAVVGTVVIVWLLISLRTESSKLSNIGMGLLIGGAAGNLIDRLFRGDAWLRGGVVDFIDFQWFPIFNIADIAVNVGAGLLILGSILSSRHQDVEPDQSESPATQTGSA